MRLSDLAKNAERTFVATGRHGLSAWSRTGATMGELACLVPTLRVRRLVSKTTVGRLRAAGFEVEPTGPPDHCTIWLPDAGKSSLASVEAAFDSPEDNPAWYPARPTAPGSAEGR